MRAAVLALLLLALPAAAVEQGKTFNFPDDREPVVSPKGTWAANYRRDGDDTPLRFSIQGAEGEEIAGFDFARSVEGAWQPGSNNLYVNDATGSNTSDCLILTEVDGKTAFASLRAALNAPDSVPTESSWIKPAQLGADAHYYVTCRRWTDDKIDFTITGHTGTVGGEFKYFMQYDLEGRAFKFVPGTN